MLDIALFLGRKTDRKYFVIILYILLLPMKKYTYYSIIVLQLHSIKVFKY